MQIAREKAYPIFDSFWFLSQMKSAVEFLESLPKSSLNQLYQSPSSALATLRLVSNISLQIVFRLLYASNSVPLSIIENWIIDNDNR